VKLYNTLGRKLQPFKPQSPNVVKVYSCGPTVYDYAHIGNLRAFIFADTLRRTLSAQGYTVHHVMNITDVGHLSSDADVGEDKLEKGAKREGKTVWDIADQYTQSFLKDTQSLNILQPNGYKGRVDGYARATDFIPQQIEIISTLLEKKYAYITKEAIYFDVTKQKDYGKLSGQKLEEKETAVREEVVQDTDKRHPYDFALWFFAVGRFEDHALQWQSPWGSGFPGWHLECSTIIHETLHEPIDIHTGGVDHIGTHHTNEIAQTEAAFGHPLAQYWLHNEFVLVNGTKMSKSLGNFYTLRDVREKGYDPLAFRLLMLQAHYRSQLNFSWGSLEAAQTFLNRIRGWADLAHQTPEQFSEVNQTYQPALEKIYAALSQDLNTTEALGWLSGLVNQTDTHGWSPKDLAMLLKQLDDVFGLGLSERLDITDQQKSLLHDRSKARQSSDWAAADAIRQKLEKEHIGVRDSNFGQIWFRL